MGFDRHPFRRLLVATASLAVVATAQPALAQADNTNTPDDEQGNPEIVVTAQFREQRLQDTPLSITAVDSELLDARNQTDLAQVAQQAPNVTLNAMGGAYGASLGASIRGIGQFDFNPAYEPGVGLYIDDVYYPTLTGANFDLLDLERVEILRGPQGTLTGRNSIGGAIKLFSKRPDENAEGFFVVGGGSRDYMEVRGGYNMPLTENLFLRVSGVHKSQDGYVDRIDYGCRFPGNAQGIPSMANTEDCVVNDLGNVNYTGVRGALRWANGGPIDVVVTGDYITEKRNSAAEVVTLTGTGTGGVNTAPYLCGPTCTYASWYLPAGGQIGAWSSRDRLLFNGWGVSGNVNIELSDALQLQSITAYREYVNKWGTDDDYTPDPRIGAQGTNDLSFWFFSQELRLNGKIGDFADFTVGGFYSDQRSVYGTRQDIRYIAPGLNFQFDGNDPINADSKAAFATVIVRPVPAMTITGGVRYTDEHKDYTFVRKNYDGTRSIFLGALDGVKAVYDGSRWDYRGSIDYRFSPEVLVYASVGTGFKGGGVTARPFDAAQALNGSFGPETVTAYEAGIKSDLFDRKLRLNLAGFINDYADIQLPLISCASLGSLAPCGARQNAGDGRIKGVELEMMAEPTDGFMLDGSVSYITGKFKNIDPRVGNAILLSDPLTTPNWKWSAGAQYRAEFPGFGFVTPRIDASYTGKTSAGRIAAGRPIEFFPSYTLVNGRITWENPEETIEVSLEGRNVFNKYYTPFRFASVYAFSGTAYSQVGRPREWMATAKFKF